MNSPQENCIHTVLTEVLGFACITEVVKTTKKAGSQVQETVERS